MAEAAAAVRAHLQVTPFALARLPKNHGSPRHPDRRNLCAPTQPTLCVALCGEGPSVEVMVVVSESVCVPIREP